MLKVLSIALGLMVAVGAPIMAFALPVNVDPDGGGPNTQINVGALDWAVGNTLALNTTGTTAPPAIGDLFQVYAHAHLSGFTNAAGGGLPGQGLNAAYEWTFVAGFAERVATNTAPTLTFNAEPGSGENFFRIYYDPAKNSSNLAGTGFNDGTLILTGHLVNAPAGSPPNGSNFTATGGGSPTGPGDPGTPLDAFIANNYPGIFSLTGNGATQLFLTVDTFDPAFFLTPPTLIAIDFSTQQTLNFRTQDPSALFTNQANSTTVPGATVGQIGTCNGCTIGPVLGGPFGGGTPNVMFLNDANATLNGELQLVPAPGSLILLGVGLVGLLLGGRSTARSRAKR